MSEQDMDRLLTMAQDYEEIKELLLQWINEEDPEEQIELRENLLEEYELHKEYYVDSFNYMQESLA